MLNRKIILQMAIKVINNIAGSNSLVSTFLIFGAYFCILKFNFFTPIIIQHITAIKNTIRKMQKVRVER